MVHSAWCSVHGAQCMVHSAQRTVHRARQRARGCTAPLHLNPNNEVHAAQFGRRQQAGHRLEAPGWLQNRQNRQSRQNRQLRGGEVCTAHAAPPFPPSTSKPIDALNLLYIVILQGPGRWDLNSFAGGRWENVVVQEGATDTC